MVLRAVLVLVHTLVLGTSFAWATDNPMALPKEVEPLIQRVTMHQLGTRAKVQAIMTLLMTPERDGGLGLQYDNAHTRTVAEVWKDRKANCWSLTTFFVACARVAGVEALYAEALNTNRWRRMGTTIRFERHLVGVIRITIIEDLVADFLPQVRRRAGTYLVALMNEDRIRALYHSNRAVELLDEGLITEAMAEADTAIRTDPNLSLGWNIQGVVHRASGNLEQAEAAYRKALQVDPKDSSALGNMEALVRQTGRTAEADQFREKAQEVRKKDPYFHAFLAEEALGENNLEEAGKRIKLAIKLLPYESEFYVLEARLRMAKGELDDAARSLEKARKWAAPGERDRFDSKLNKLKESQKK